MPALVHGHGTTLEHPSLLCPWGSQMVGWLGAGMNGPNTQTKRNEKKEEKRNGNKDMYSIQ